jgi:UDP-N-acetylmuramoylalanine--D-glutamate ligase
LGGGDSGVGAALLANHLGFEVFVSDSKPLKEKYRRELLDHKISFEEGGHAPENWGAVYTVIKSPGIPETAPVVQQLMQTGAEIISEIEFGGRFYHGRVIAITGSNGKTTTTLLTYHLLQKAGLNVKVGGNVGKSFARQLVDDAHPDWFVLEVSSFQLDNINSFRPYIAILLNITPDHLDRYGYQIEAYAASKMHIGAYQEHDDYFVYCADDPITLSLLRKTRLKSKLVGFSILKPIDEGAFLENENIIIQINKSGITMNMHTLALQGKHNLYNSMAAGIAGRILELRKEIIRESLTDFQNVEHRMEFVNSVCGVNYINDSKATNINSVWYALESLDTEIVWIAGGIDKGNDYGMIEDLVKQKVKALICLGTDNTKLKVAFENKVPQLQEARNMREAVMLAYKSAKKGDTVLLSPACASFDLFEDYEERGRLFKEAVRGL